MKNLLNKNTIIKKYLNFLKYNYKNFFFFKNTFKNNKILQISNYNFYKKKIYKNFFFLNLRHFKNIKKNNSFLNFFYKKELFFFMFLKCFKLILSKINKKTFIKDKLFKYILYKIYLNNLSLINVLN